MKNLCSLIRDIRGTMAIETAIVAPVLVLLALGTFEVSNIVSRQHELQTAANEGEVIALATARGATVEVSTIKEILAKSVSLSDDQITISRFYRCNDSDVTTTDPDSCGTDAVVASYIELDITDTYTPVWTQFGVGKPIDFNVERTVQLS
ncbi:TadE/TadG family type IV pilus assembly protein [Erythrobacter sp. HKB08]|uniref:TadE/TadG family type IV pilus assembly protein n=1 Tax=Erythrobacter sp. HKB08 TaxID=2502843 RepID=UPI001008ADF6|nr:TadE/TadG family type IV pilus assembly protein [Erythrobacter sp. HKB08]